MKIKFNRNVFLALMLIIPIAIISKYIQYNFLPEKYFIDSNNVLNMINFNSTNGAGIAFIVTAQIFKTINIFNFTTINEWSIFLAIIFNSILFAILLIDKKYNIKQYIFIYASIAILNIYIFNIGKDIIQLCVFLLIYIITSKNIKDNKKVVTISIILGLEAILFRPYYVLILFAFLLSYIILDKLYLKKSKNNKVISPIILIIGIFMIAILCSKSIFPSSYNKLINVRDETTAYLTASTEINNIIKNESFIAFIINYIINGARILFPIELIGKGMKYLPFVVYQIFITYSLIKSIRQLNKENVISVCIVIGFLIGSTVFEPDFGSVIRHESVLILTLIELTNIKVNKDATEMKQGKDKKVIESNELIEMRKI